MNKICPPTTVSSPPLETIVLWQEETDKVNMRTSPPTPSPRNGEGDKGVDKDRLGFLPLV
jgi:hypothetical protein